MVKQLQQWIVNTTVRLRRKWILWKSGCESWELYQRINDPNVFYRADTVGGFYYGYRHVYCFANYNHDIYHLDLAFDGTTQIEQWCKGQCRGQFRFDIHRIELDTDWRFNELFGADMIFVAFTDERDYNWFMLRWT